MLCKEKKIRVAKERLINEDIPRVADEFEKLIRSSPNSNFIVESNPWISRFLWVMLRKSVISYN